LTNCRLFYSGQSVCEKDAVLDSRYVEVRALTMVTNKLQWVLKNVPQYNAVLTSTIAQYMEVHLSAKLVKTHSMNSEY